MIRAYEEVRYYQFRGAYQLFYRLILVAFVELMEINVHLTFVFVLVVLRLQVQLVLMVLVLEQQLNLKIHLDSKKEQKSFSFYPLNLILKKKLTVGIFRAVRV